MKKIQIPPQVIDALAEAITCAVEDRIKNDPDVEDTYLRITAEDNKFTVKVMYLEESNATSPNNDVALLNLMYDFNNSVGNEYWVPDPGAIYRLAESYSEMLAVNIGLN